jgi:hypothetical protein
MSAAAVTMRLLRTEQLRRLCLALRARPADGPQGGPPPRGGSAAQGTSTTRPKAERPST